MAKNDHSSAVADLVRLGKQLAPGELSTEAFNVHGVSTRLITDSDVVARAIAGLLRAFSSGQEQAVAEPDIEVHLFTVDALDERMAPVPDDATMLYDWGMVKIYHSGTHRHLTVESRVRVMADLEKRQAVGFVDRQSLDSDWLISHLVFYPLWAQLLKEEGLFPFHAAGLAKGGQGFLFPGKSGSGKSTLSLHLVRSGYGLLSDDTVFLRETDGRVEALAFPEEINVTDETVDLFPDLARVENFTVNELRQKSSFSIEELYPGCVTDRSIPALLVFPQIAGDEATVLKPMSRTEALALSMRYGFFFMDPSTTGRHFEILSLLARQSECYRLFSGRDQEELERVVDTLLTGTAEQENQTSGERKE
jgi:hypothetical protein